jgi:hypothetical protein
MMDYDLAREKLSNFIEKWSDSQGDQGKLQKVESESFIQFVHLKLCAAGIPSPIFKGKV